MQDATTKLASDKQVTKRDVEGISAMEMLNDPMLTTHLAGVATSIAAAARLNQTNQNNSVTPKKIVKQQIMAPLTDKE